MIFGPAFFLLDDGRQGGVVPPTDARLYDGSLTEWSANPILLLVTG